MSEQQSRRSERSMFQLLELIHLAVKIHFENEKDNGARVLTIRLKDRAYVCDPERFLKAFVSDRFKTIQTMINESFVRIQ